MSEYKKVNVTELKPGMRIAQNVENKYGAILISPGMVLQEGIIAKLQKLGIRKVSIFAESESEIDDVFLEVPRKYQENVLRMKGIFYSLNKGRQLEYEEIKQIVDDLFWIEVDQELLSILTQMRDVEKYTYIHSVNVGMLSIIFGRWIKMPEKNLKLLAYAGFLHDVGKSRIPAEILRKKGSLTEEEFEIMKKHSVYGYDIVRDCVFVTNKLARAVLFHHERKDGSGYPLGIKGDKIPFMARVLAIVDTFDAMTSDRVYKRHQPPFDVLKMLKQETLHTLDISLVKSFIKNISHYYLGEKVILNNGQKGEIVFINPDYPTEPIVKVEEEFVDLSKNKLNIREFVTIPRLVER
ncbi:MAG: HD-GYP domain-containing protein [Halanaerobiaceae bacterium]